MISIFILSVLIAFLFFCGILQINNPSKQRYPVTGVDVSSYQGNINWEELSRNDIKFAYIKATEGSSYVDPKFKYNWEEAGKTELRIGAYHFFSFDSPGITQAENFINTVPIQEDTLPPVIDVELYGDKEQNLPDEATVKQELGIMIELLEDHYGKAPILYVTEKTYKLYIDKHFPNSSLWVRSVYEKPKYINNDKWILWQYSNRKILSGYRGKERFIDMNVYNGTVEEFDINTLCPNI